ncbi:cAMP-dependent protein kinase catalytic subunit alpha-like [Homalodisca vitripennis]|uniref:cAMP-dependent protein kinase catalytic subunit alpha-like n=1 Tax=Homalodisca vitripennis TaxID=197043 RepID=UPI001EEC5C77|nr:cAMP-dependent protein kinase catalytic subunit alpha-like [Homalodisca vitripennis]KAG8331983.1 hypothetical protein J6590_029587 [Homalodisca vitripennis]
MSKDNDSANSRFPDYGPLDIENYKEFLEKSKITFYEDWFKPFLHKEKLSDFDQLQILGSGSFGNVILIKHQESGKFYAMKAIEKEKVIKYKQLEHTRNEKLILQCLNYPLTVYLMYCFKDNSYIYIVMPFITGGELFGHLRKFGKFDEVQARFYTSQIILALEYLHYLDLIFRDLKPENILIDHTGYLKVTDFGFCKRMTRNRTYTLCGTPEYLAPEVILSKGYGKAVDWWAIGVLMYELVAGNPPFYANDPMKIYEKIVANKYKIPPFFSPDLKDIVKNILQVDLSRRFGNLKNGVDDIKEHKWFRQINWMAVLNRKVAAPYMPKYKAPGDTTNFEKNKWEPLVISKENKYPEEFADF